MVSPRSIFASIRRRSSASSSLSAAPSFCFSVSIFGPPGLNLLNQSLPRLAGPALRGAAVVYSISDKTDVRTGMEQALRHHALRTERPSGCTVLGLTSNLALVLRTLTAPARAALIRSASCSGVRVAGRAIYLHAWPAEGLRGPILG
jgi:hypothetical protein